MKKISFYMFALLAVLFTFSACGENGGENGGGDKNPPADDVTKVACEFAYGDFYGEDIMLGIHTFEAALTSGDAYYTEDWQIEGTGYNVVIDFLSEKNTKFMPTAGTYKIYEEDMQPEIGIALLSIVDIKDGEVVNELEFTDASVVLSNDKIVVKCTDSDNKKYEFTCSGPFAYDLACRNNYGEPLELINKTYTSTQCQLAYLGQTDFGDYIDIFISNDELDFAIAILANDGTGTDASKLTGTYPVKFANESHITLPGSSEVSPQGIGVSPSYASKYNNNQPTIPIYYFYSGNVTIETNKITIDVVSAFGSTFKVTYTGNVTIQNKSQQQAPQYVLQVPALQQKAFAARMRK